MNDFKEINEFLDFNDFIIKQRSTLFKENPYNFNEKYPQLIRSQLDDKIKSILKETPKSFFDNLTSKTIEKFKEYIKSGKQLAATKMEMYSPFSFAETVTRLAEKKAANPIETARVLDLFQFQYKSTWEECLSAAMSIFRRMHVVSDSDLIIKEGLTAGRNSERYSVYPTRLDEALGPHSMLFAQSGAEHRRLRKPFEKMFGERSFEKGYLHHLARKMLVFNSDFQETSNTSISAIPELNADITQIINNSQTLTEHEQRDTSELLDMASSHTTRTTEKFIMQLLKRHPDWIQQIYLDWEKRFGEIDCKDLENLDHLLPDENPEERLIVFVKGGEWRGKMITPSLTVHAFLAEACRLFPVVPHIIRVAKERFTLGGTEINPGEVVMFNILGAQRNAEEWDEPTRFLPTRFMTSGEIPKIERILLNFGHPTGPERCLGRHMAINSLLLFTAVRAMCFAAILPNGIGLANMKKYLSNERELDSVFDLEFTEEREIPSYVVYPPFIETTE